MFAIVFDRDATESFNHLVLARLGLLALAPPFGHRMSDCLAKWSRVAVLPPDQCQFVELIPCCHQSDGYADQCQKGHGIEFLVQEDSQADKHDQTPDNAATQPLCGADRLNIFSLCEARFTRVSHSPPPSRLRILSQLVSSGPNPIRLVRGTCEVDHKYVRPLIDTDTIFFEFPVPGKVRLVFSARFLQLPPSAWHIDMGIEHRILLLLPDTPHSLQQHLEFFVPQILPERHPVLCFALQESIQISKQFR